MVWICQFMAFANWIEELNCLISTCCYYKLWFSQIAYIYNWWIMSIYFSMIWNKPWWSWLKQLNHIFLNIPNQNFKLSLILSSRIMFIISIFAAFLEFMGSWNIWIGCAWEWIFRWMILLFTQVFFSWNQTATLWNITDWWWILIFMSLQLCQ